MSSLFFTLNDLEIEVHNNKIIVKAILIILKKFIKNEIFCNKYDSKY